MKPLVLVLIVGQIFQMIVMAFVVALALNNQARLDRTTPIETGRVWVDSLEAQHGQIMRELRHRNAAADTTAYTPGP